MTAPIWMGAPPEVHSTLLSSGPGPGSLLAAAEAWKALSINYTETADELTALLAGVRAGTWDGPSAETYVAAHAPYLAWLRLESANSAALAAEQETAAAAYTTALAAMPTLGELAANHATHAVLLGTNFFGINTIPIALNEVDYARMWLQAAAVMGAYEGVAGASVAAAPSSEPAPTITKTANPAAATSSGPPAWFENLQGFLEGLYAQPPYPNVGDFPQYAQILNFFNQIGFTSINDPIANWLLPLNGSSWLPPVGVPGSWLAFTGDPLAYLNPASIAYVLSVPLDPGSYVAFTGIVIADDLLAIIYTAAVNPQALILVVPLASVEIIGSTIGNTIQVLHYVLEQTLAVVLPAILPLVAASAVPLAAAPIGAAGLAGLAGLAPVAAAPVLPPPFGVAATPPPTPAPPSPAPAPVPVELTHTAALPPAPSAPPPTPAGPTSVTMEGMMYMIGDLGLVARRAASDSAKVKKTAPVNVETPSPIAGPDEQRPARRRRRAKSTMLGRGYEYMDVEPEPEDLELEPESTVTASDRNAGPLGFAGSAAKAGAAKPAGLASATQDQFGGSSGLPMLPSTWNQDGGRETD
jgi:PPE-repeat protein